MKKTPRECWIALAAVVAMVLATLLFVYGPQSKKLDELKTQKSLLQRSLVADSVKASVVPEMLRQIGEMKNRYRDFDRKLPKNKELGAFLAEITGKLSSQELVDPSIEPGDPTAGRFYHTLPIIIRCRGSYLGLMNFLEQIGKMERLTRVHSLVIDKRADEKYLDIKMQLNIYFTNA